jgi:subfamily B ATP-binding cassette protein MsbA
MASEKESSALSKKEKRRKTWKALPEIWALIRPRRGLLALGFVLMAVNRVCGLVLPASTKYFIDNVIGKRQTELLTPIVLGVLAATIVQGLTSFTLTQLLSKSAQKMIAELRRQVQAHIGRLPVSFYDANKTGALVSRIMSDVEGVRNLIGTGLVEFVGGLMTAVIALGYLLHTSVTMTLLAFGILLVFGVGINQAFKTIRPIFRARPKINAEVTGRLTESLGGVRVVKGYHAEAREEGVFSAGVQRLLDNVLKTLTATSLMSLSGAGLMGLVSALIMEFGGHKILAGGMSLGQFFAFNIFLGLLIAPVFRLWPLGRRSRKPLRDWSARGRF